MKDGGYYNDMYGMFCVADVYPLRLVCFQCKELYLETDPAEIRRVNAEIRQQRWVMMNFCCAKCEREYEKKHIFYRLFKKKRRKETACDESPYW